MSVILWLVWGTSLNDGEGVGETRLTGDFDGATARIIKWTFGAFTGKTLVGESNGAAQIHQ